MRCEGSFPRVRREGDPGPVSSPVERPGQHQQHGDADQRPAQQRDHGAVLQIQRQAQPRFFDRAQALQRAQQRARAQLAQCGTEVFDVRRLVAADVAHHVDADLRQQLVEQFLAVDEVIVEGALGDAGLLDALAMLPLALPDRKSTRLNSSH